MGDVDTSQLSAARTGDAYGDAVAKVREAAAYLFLTDQDAPYAAVGHFAGMLSTRVTRALGYLVQVEALLGRRLATGKRVNTAATRKTVKLLVSTRTELGAALVTDARADIVQAAEGVGGTSLEELRDELTGIRSLLDAELTKLSAGVTRLLTCVSDYDPDVPERYLTGSRVGGVVEALASADKFSRSGRYDAAVEKLSVAFAGLNIPAAVVTGRKLDTQVDPLPESAVTVVQGSAMLPVSVATVAELQVVAGPGAVPYVLQVPLSAAPALASRDLGVGVRFHAAESATLWFTCAHDGLLRLGICSGSATVSGSVLTDLFADFVSDAVRVSDMLRLNYEATQIDVAVAHVLDAHTLLLDTPPGDGSWAYQAFVQPTLSLSVGGSAFQVSLDMTGSSLNLPVAEFAAAFDASVNHAVEFGYNLISGISWIRDNEVGRLLVLQDTRFCASVLQATAYHADGAANDALSLSQGGATRSCTFTHAVLTPDEAAAELLSSMAGLLTTTAVTSGVLRLVGLYNDDPLLVLTGSSADTELSLRAAAVGRMTSLDDVNAAWAGTPFSLIAGPGGQAALHAVGCTSVSVLTGGGASLLGLPAGGHTGVTSSVRAVGLRVSDQVQGVDGSWLAAVTSVNGSVCTLDRDVPAVSGVYRVVCGGMLSYDVLVVGSEHIKVLAGRLASGVPSEVWDMWFRYLPVSDRGAALSVLSDYRSVLEDLQVRITAFSVTRLPELDSLFGSLSRFSLDAGEWYLAGLQLPEFFFGQERSLRSASVLMDAVGRAISALNARGA